MNVAGFFAVYGEVIKKAVFVLKRVIE